MNDLTKILPVVRTIASEYHPVLVSVVENTDKECKNCITVSNGKTDSVSLKNLFDAWFQSNENPPEGISIPYFPHFQFTWFKSTGRILEGK
ncbi:MAG: hypothetical protein HC906_18190 [Bacteroidales bacterium]|nr:hypothetical protein [Bacteroidales bacterium]